MTRLTFTDFDAFAEVVRDASVTMRICSREVSRWTLRYATVGAIGVQRGFEGGGSVAEGATGRDGWTFYHQSRPVRANGQVMGTDEVFGAPPGSEFCLACKPSHAWLTVFVPTALLFPLAPELAFASNAVPLVLKPPPHVTRRFASLVQRFLAMTESRPQLFDDPVALDSYRYDLVSATQELFTRSRHPAGGQFARWHRLTQSTLQLGMSRPDHSMSVSELARRTGAPDRTLRTAFSRIYGFSPQEYLRIQRLCEARRLLHAGDPDQMTVTEVAFGLGFWDLGRFAGAYRTLFGERPSETLRRRVRGSLRVRDYPI